MEYKSATMFVLILILTFPIILLAYSIPQKENLAFIEKLAPSFKLGEFDMKDYRVWCASVIKDKNGKYYIERINFFLIFPGKQKREKYNYETNIVLNSESCFCGSIGKCTNRKIWNLD